MNASSTDVATIDDRLRPAAALDIARELTDRLFLAFQMKGPDDEDQRKKLLVLYVEALSKYPMWAIHEACSRFINGEVKAAEKKWAPKPAEICEVVREIIEPVKRELRIAASAARAERPKHHTPTAFQKAHPHLYPEIFGMVGTQEELP